MAGSIIRRAVGRFVGSTPHEVKAIAEDAAILALIVVAATTAERLVEMLLGEHVPPMIGWLLTISLWVMAGIYAIGVLATMRKLIAARFAPGKGWAIAGAASGSGAHRKTEVANNRRRTDRPLTVLVVDDDALVARAVRLTLETDARIGTIMTANSPDAAIARIQAAPIDEAPDVMLIDVNYAGIVKTGIDALREIRQAAPRSKLLIMSVGRDAETVRSAVANDADGFIWKNESAVDFAEAVVSATHHTFFVASKSVARDVLGTPPVQPVSEPVG